MNRITLSDIRTYVIDATTENDFDAEMRDRFEDAILDAAPLDTWIFNGHEFMTTALSVDEYWAIIERVASEAT